MKAALFIVLSLSALAFAGPAFKNNQIDAEKAHHQSQYMTTGDLKQTQATETLKQWCFSSQMSQPELTASFKKLVGIVKSSPEDQSTEAAVMSERICQGTIVQKSAQTGETIANTGADAQAHELIKDVYMDALIACESRECMRQLIKIIHSNEVDSIRASYYMTRIAVSEKDSINKDYTEVKQLAESFIQKQGKSASEAIERQKLFAVTALLGKSCENKQQSVELKQTAEQVVKTIVDTYIKPVSQQEVEQYQQQEPQQQSSQVAKKIAKRNAALKALANIPGWVLKEIDQVEEILVQLAENKQELVTVRQSAIECLEQNDSVLKQLKQITFDQEEPIEVRIAAYRALMTTVYAGMKDEQSKQQMASEILSQVVKHCEDQRNQQQDDQFCLYAISHLDNLRSSQQPEHQAIKECIAKNKQHYMQIQLLVKKFKQQLSDVRKSSRNYKLEQEFNQLESGLILEGDIIYESKNNHHQQQFQILPKLVRVNMSMPVMGETVNVVEITLRQNQMDEELLSALKLVQTAKFNTESMSKVVDSFKSSVEKQQQKSGKQEEQQTAEADLSIKVDGCTVVYLCVDDFKSASTSTASHQRNTRSIYQSSSIIDEIIQHLKNKPVNFNRGFNFNIAERLASVLDVEANIIAGLRFNSRVQGQSSKDFEIVAQVEPRFAFETIIGPAKVSSKKLLQRVSTKTALGFTLRFKQDELVDVQIDLPMNTMELFTVESQMVEKSNSMPDSYTYLPESIYGQEDIYSPVEEFVRAKSQLLAADEDEIKTVRKFKRSIFDNKKSIIKFMQGKQNTFAHSIETSEEVARLTGLRGKLRVVASPKDMSFLVQAVAQKYEPSMQGYRVQVQKVQRGSELEQFIWTISTPGSRFDRTMQLRVTKQENSQRTIVKTEIQSPKMSATAQYELIHDGRQYAIKVDMASTRGKQWRHHFEAGVLRGSQSQSGRIATSYKPYLTVESTLLKRPVQMQGVVSYQESPKSVISFELKCPTWGDFVQGKIILEQRSTSSFANKRSLMSRSMRSPVELLLQNDLTLTSEIVAQIAEYSAKVHQMIEWDSNKWNLQADHSVMLRNIRKSVEQQISSNLKLNKDQQMWTVQRKCPQQERKEFRLTIVSDNKSPVSHQFAAELRYNGKRTSNLQSIVAFKHKVDYSQLTPNKVELGYVIELVASELQINEKITGRTQVAFERNSFRSLQTEMSSRNKSAKLNLEFVSLEQHALELVFQGERVNHRTTVRATQRQFSMQSHSEKQGQTVCKLVLEILKQQGECQVIVELPRMSTQVAVDLKLASGKLSSVAVQTPRFASKGEFSFESMTRGNKHVPTFWKRSPLGGLSSLRLKTDLKDTMNQEAYWLESAWNTDADKQSFIRFDSPIYRTDLEFDPREQSTKFGSFARSKRSTQNYNQLYSTEESVLRQALKEKLNLGNKLWMIRSIVSSPSQVEELKQQARRALFEYADRRQAHKHSFDWNPVEQRVNFNMERVPSAEFQKQQQWPMRFTGDLSTNWWNQKQQQQQQQRPSSLNMESEWIDFDMDVKPFDGEESFAKVSALSRHRRSPFKKHESEMRYKKDQGYKAWMKHQDAKDKRHSFQVEADESPKNWAKMTYESDKHGKGQYEHQWRKQVSKRSHQQRGEEDIYANKIAFESQSPIANEWSHRTQLQWEEPIKMLGNYHHQQQQQQRIRRSLDSELERRFGAINYLKHLNARLNSQTQMNQAELYNVDFDFQPESHARLSMLMPEDMLHSTSIEFQPTEQLYKLQSKLYNRRTQEPSYELLASTKPVLGLATANQEAVFIDEQHPMLERPLTNRLVSNLFKQPLKLDYTDKYGRVARVDYDQSPISADKYQGLRQKRAAVYYKDDSNDFEHQSSYDFYPEAVLGFSPAKRVPGDLSMKAQTKYGPIVLNVDSDDKTIDLQLESPVLGAKLTCESASNSKKLIKLTVDNKKQNVQLAKIVRKNPILKDCELVQKVAQKLDQGRFEHQTELLVSIVDAIFKIKSQTMMDQRPVMNIEGEFNQQQEKAFVKVDGMRTSGQLMIDLVTRSANLVVDVDNKRTVQHQTRIVRLSDKFYSIESMTTYKQQPLYKLSGKVSSHIFSSHSLRRNSGPIAEHMSTFEAVVYEPEQIQISAQYDCLNKVARVVTKSVTGKASSDVLISFDEQAEEVDVKVRAQDQRGISYQMQRTINVTPLIQAY